MSKEVSQADLDEIEEICYNDGYEIDDIQDAMTVLDDDLVQEITEDFEPDILKGVKFIEYQIKFKQDNNEYDIDTPVETIDTGMPEDCSFYEAKKFLNSKGYILVETLERLKNPDLIVEVSASLEDKIANAKNFNATKIDKKIVVDAYNAIKAMAGKGGFDYNDNALDNYFTAKEITDGTLEQVMKRNKGFYTVIIEVRKTLNDFGYFVEIELVITPQGNIEVLVKENQRIKRNDVNVKRFDVTEYKTAIKYAKWVE